MKKLFLLLFAIGLTTISSVSMAALSNNGIRNETRFLSDKMAYELNLTNAQYNDIYEINYDFIYSINRVMDYAVKGYEWAMNDYYDELDLRNDELRYVLNNTQYRRFMRTEYFYRPIFVASSRWSFRVYNNYVNRNQFYLPKPYHYQTYKGGNSRSNYTSNSYYNGRHKHDSYYNDNNYSVRNDRTYQSNRRSDFGSVSVRPNTTSRPRNVRPGNSSYVNTQQNTGIGSGVSTRPNNNSGIGSGASTRPNNNSGIGSGASTRPNNNGGIGSGASTRPNNNGGIGSGAGTRPSNDGGIGSGAGTRPSNDGGIGSGVGTRPSNDGGIGSGAGTRPSNDGGIGSGAGTRPSNNNSTSTSRRRSSSSTRSTAASDDDNSERRTSSRRR